MRKNSTYQLDRELVKKYNRQRDTNKNKPVCLAPWKSMRFAPDGDISVCCHNHAYPIGHYPEDTPIRAWEGKAMKTLRKHLKNADFSKGCQVCYPSFVSRNFDMVNPLLYERYKANKHQPVILDFKIATKCNLRCIMCAEYSSSSIRQHKHIPDRPEVYDSHFIDVIRPWIAGVKEFRFSGGEPFLSDLYLDMWKEITTCNPEALITIQTNGTILNDDIRAIMEKGNFSINVSVDAVDKKTYENIRVGANKAHVWENIDYFSRYCRERGNFFGITACMMRDNWQEIPSLVNLANEKHAVLWINNVYFPFKNAMWLESPERLEQIIHTLENISIQSTTECEKNNKNVYDGAINSLKKWKTDASRRINNSTLYINKTQFLKIFSDHIQKMPVSDKEKAVFSKKISDVLISLKSKNIMNIFLYLENQFKMELAMSVFKDMDKSECYENLVMLTPHKNKSE
ncbi:MAG: radical SAM protein [Bacteroidales bacterium]